jgi:hypothetical protein
MRDLAAFGRQAAFTSLVLALWLPLAASAQVAYNTIPATLPPNVASEGFQADGGRELGDLIQFASGSGVLSQVALVMSTQATIALYPAFPGSGGPSWTHPVTLNIYNVDNSGANPAPGALIATRTSVATIPWRPASDPTCADPTRWRAGDGICYSGLAFTVTFDFTGVAVPAQVIYGVAYNTQTYGYAPIGVVGAYDSLNTGLAQVPPSVGTNPFPDTAYWNTTVAGNYADGGVAGVGIFRRDTGWTPFSGAVTFAMVGSGAAGSGIAVPTLGPLAMLLLAFGIAFVAWRTTRMR